MLALPLGPSNSYSFSTASHGIRRRSAASASRARVNSFSFTSSCWRAASHFCGDTILGRLICFASISGFISFSFILASFDFVCSFFFIKLVHRERSCSATRRRADRDQHHVCHTHGTHYPLPFLPACLFVFSKYA